MSGRNSPSLIGGPSPRRVDRIRKIKDGVVRLGYPREAGIGSVLAKAEVVPLDVDVADRVGSGLNRILSSHEHVAGDGDVARPGAKTNRRVVSAIFAVGGAGRPGLVDEIVRDHGRTLRVLDPDGVGMAAIRRKSGSGKVVSRYCPSGNINVVARRIEELVVENLQARYVRRVISRDESAKRGRMGR